MPKFTIRDTGVFRTDPFVLLNSGGIPVAQSYSEIGKFDSDGLLEIVDYIATIEALLKEAGELLEPIAEHDVNLALPDDTKVAHFISIKEFNRAAEVGKKIQKTLGGEA